MASIDQLVQQWSRWDRDPETKTAIEQLHADGNISELEERLRGRIAFGTAGLRARMEAGFTRINSLTVLQTSQGLAAYASSNVSDAVEKGVVVGCDARLNSWKFANVAAAAFAAKGFKVYLLEDVVHTPLVPYTVARLGAAVGVMITASHNPAYDNGYKVYWENACQIIPPHDSGIATAISQNLEPVSWMRPDEPDAIPTLLSHMESEYIENVCSHLVLPHLPTSPSGAYPLPRFVYTPMHGVGLRPMSALLDSIHEHCIEPTDPTMVVVPEQARPNPHFPTVKFPNPEEAGALDLAIQTANSHDISLIIATDPDADRLAIAVRRIRPASESKTTPAWIQLTGNQVGILLAHFSLTHLAKSSPRDKLAMLCSTVSTSMLSAVAATEGFQCTETLTGFKWLGNVAKRLEADRDLIVPFAFEEALGYMFTSAGYDKDGIAAAAVFLTACATWRQKEGLDPFEKMIQLYERYGWFVDRNCYVVSPNTKTTEAVFADIRKIGRERLVSINVTRWRDLTIGTDTATKDNIPELPVDPTSQMITVEGTLDNEGGNGATIRFTARGSGTEPKIKLYVECKADNEKEATEGAEYVRDLLLKEWFGKAEYGLKMPVLAKAAGSES